MPSMLRNVLLLTVMVVVDGAVLFFVPESGERTTLGLLLLVPIIIVATYMELPEVFTRSIRPQARPRHFPALRANVDAFMTEVKRLNWLVVDLDRGFGRPEETAPEIEACHRRMSELLVEIQKSAGRPDWAMEEGEAAGESGASGHSAPASPGAGG